LNVFGEIAIVKRSQNIQRKSKNSKGLPLLHCGIASDHATDCFTFLNPKTKRFVESRDVNLWLNQTHVAHEGLSPHSQLSSAVHVPLENNSDDDLHMEEETTDTKNMIRPTNIPPSDASTNSDNNDQAIPPPALFSPAPTLQSPVAKRMVCEVEPHLLDLLETTLLIRDSPSV